ncbi:ribose-5-phosphate isomerase [Desulfonatronum thiosulfatophilum]|uniref:Ribose-5-phosphate isomerase n=1 Tax=Desulfonatronum thiosulfatophilum TaxID=617002 RepID=A0A1G6A8U7_9BACT|nr:ribose 5-phosphate isomerase B [Desulfonatronum thiosulfatophilum]SDB04483.1 ribose-5-phosphate isomerase [Desulfonatronum thiosulfatophilum]
MDIRTVVIGSDHAGFDFKKIMTGHIRDLGYDVHDIGPTSTDSCDYPLMAGELCRVVLATHNPGILICGTGLGMSMAANRFPGIRASLCTNEFLARMARAHNNANVLCLGSRVLGSELAKSIVSVFLTTQFEGQRHQRRIDQLESLVSQH